MCTMLTFILDEKVDYPIEVAGVRHAGRDGGAVYVRNGD